MAHGTTQNRMRLPQTRLHPACTNKWHSFKKSILSNLSNLTNLRYTNFRFKIVIDNFNFYYLHYDRYVNKKTT